MGNDGGNIIRRLSRTTENPSTVPIIWEWPGHHEVEGGNVLYLDGHVDFVRYPGKFPMTEKFIEALREIDAEVSGDCLPISSR
jgi:prepilin-type processing-associated H-X9-DG protein